MKVHALTLLSGIQLFVVSANNLNGHHAHLKRQGASRAIVSLVYVSDVLPPSPTSLYFYLLFSTLTATQPPLATGTDIPPLASITLGMATRVAPQFSATYTPGATPPIKDAPVLPTARMFFFVAFTVFDVSKDNPVSLTGWPTQDKVPPTGSFLVI